MFDNLCVKFDDNATYVNGIISDFEDLILECSKQFIVSRPSNGKVSRQKWYDKDCRLAKQKSYQFLRKN